MRNSFKVEIDGANRSSYQSDGMTHSAFEMAQASDGWFYVLIAQVEGETGPPPDTDDTGLFVAGVVNTGGSVSSQGDFQTATSVFNLLPGPVFRTISTTLYSSSLYASDYPSPDPADGVYRSDLSVTLELTDGTTVHDTFVIVATEAGTTFATEAPADDETFYLRFASASVLPVMVEDSKITITGPDVALDANRKPFRLPSGGLLHAETFNALIKWVGDCLVLKPIKPDVVTKKSNPMKAVYKIRRKGGFAYVSDARDIIKWLAKRLKDE